MNEEEKLRSELKKNELDALRKLETWGSSLFLGSLGLLGKQLIDWELNPEQSKQLILPVAIVVLPSTIGLVAFMFLRTVNSRSFKLSVALLRLAGVDDSKRRFSWGILGYLFALMPFALGFAISWFFAIREPDRMLPMFAVSVVGVFALTISILVHYLSRRVPKLRTKPHSAAAAELASVQVENITPASATPLP